METLIACAGLIALGAITPGPNNLAVLRIAVAKGMAAALPATAGIVLGGLTMLALGQMGLAALIETHPWLRHAIAVCGGTYLAWLGLVLVWRSFQPGRAMDSDASVPDGALALFAFQFTNPKAWALVLTVSAAAPEAGGDTATMLLFALFLAIPSICLIAWAAFGRLIAPLLSNALARARFDRAMGALLAASALVLVNKS